MKACEWCNKNSEELIVYTDAIGCDHSICKNCKDKVDESICRKCGSLTDTNMMIDGLCTTCIQINMQKKCKKREEIRMGVDRELIAGATSEITFTNEDYETWLTMGKAFSPSNTANSKELRRIWIMVKLNAAGIYDNSVISNHFNCVETLLDRNFSKLINNKCRIIIGNTSETRKEVRSYNVIDYEDDAYIVSV